MKAWTISELDNVVTALEPLIGARLQEVQTSDADLVLGFYTPDGLLWLWADLHAIRPGLLPWMELPLHIPSRKNPLHLFLRAHFLDRVLRGIEHRDRIVYLRFGKEGDELELELRLFPHGRNVLARSGDRKIAWQKPREIVERPAPPAAEKVRGLEELRREWIDARAGKGVTKTTKDVKSRLESELAKKKNAVVKVEKELEAKRDTPWKRVGDWLKANQTLAVPKEFEPFVDKRRKLSWNIEECYTKARDIEGKIYGTEKRLETLRTEIASLEERIIKPLKTDALQKPKFHQPLVQAEAQGRTLRLNDELTVIAGKSAADNLKLLRKARAWDLWIHLRDHPASHAILFRNKSTNVSEAVLHQVVEWYVKQFLGQKYKDASGEKFVIQIAECRFVRPIKGDKLGRVTVHEERTMTYRVPNP